MIMRPSLPGDSARSFEMSGVTLASCAIRLPAIRNASITIGREFFIIVLLSSYLRGLQINLWSLFRRPREPVYESCLPEPRLIVRNQCPLAHSDAELALVRFRDYFARILARSQVSPDEFVQTKLFRPADFNGAIGG